MDAGELIHALERSMRLPVFQHRLCLGRTNARQRIQCRSIDRRC